METITTVVAELVVALRGLTTTEVCPGGWPWAVSALGIGVGLLPAIGALAVALLRRRIGSRYGPAESVLLVGTGLLTAGLLPLLLFVVTGRIMSAAAAGDDVPGMSARTLRDLGSTVCAVGPQDEYLGGGTVAEAFGAGGPLRAGVAVLVFVALPLVAAMFTAAQARLALRRGPRWPVRFFWLPVVAVALLTLDAPAGSSGHLWLGTAAGAFLGVPVLLAVRPPTWEVVRRSQAPRSPGRRPWRRAATPARREVERILARSEPAGAAPGSTPSGSGSAEPPAAPAPPGPGLAERLAARFAARTAQPPVVPLPRDGGTAAGPAEPTRTERAAARPAPTLVAPAPTGAPPRFRLVRRLGDGGFGRVWLAHDARHRALVALKAAHARDADTEERIRREARALAAVDHPHCVRILDLVHAGSDPGLRGLDGMVIVMEYVRGMSVGELVRSRGPLDDVAAARVWASMAGALAAAHARGVLHRDVKPGNVVVDADGSAHLIDFGIARQSGDATLTMAGFVLGTPDFLTPEVAAGGRATPQSDSWQLAATISYALTGHPPRGGHADALSGLRAAASGAPLTHLPARSAHLALLHAALDPEPARRPPLPVVQQALEQWLRHVGARPDGPVAAGVRTG